MKEPRKDTDEIVRMELDKEIETLCAALEGTGAPPVDVLAEDMTVRIAGLMIEVRRDLRHRLQTAPMDELIEILEDLRRLLKKGREAPRRT